MPAPTTEELMWRLDDLRSDLRENIQTLAALINKKVEAEVLHLQQQAQDEKTAQLLARVTALEEVNRKKAEEARERAKERERVRQQDRRLIVTALVWPLGMSLLQVYLTLKGS